MRVHDNGTSSGSPAAALHAHARALVTPQQVDAYARDGVVKVARVVDESFIDPLIELAERQLRAPGRWVTDSNRGGVSGRIFTDRYLWREQPLVRDFVFHSGVAELAARLMESSAARFYFDHLLVKQPDTAEPTPWHQDVPYWPFLGTQICSVWVALTRCSVAESALEFVRGSHLWNRYYAPVPFGVKAGFTADCKGEACPDIEATRGRYDVVGFDMEPGDALVFSAWTLHGARGNAGSHKRVALSTRWLGDDAIWQPHPGSDPSVTQADVCVAPGEPPIDDDRFPCVWASQAP